MTFPILNRRSWILLAVLVGVILLQHIPARVHFRMVRLRVRMESPEGILLQGVDWTEIHSATLHFDTATVQEFGGEFGLGIPAGTTIDIHAAGTPVTNPDRERVTLSPESMSISASQPLRFYYRGVPIAVTRSLTTLADRERPRLQVRGRFRLLTTLRHVFSLLRETDFPQRLHPPQWAHLNAEARLRPEHTFQFSDELQVQSDQQPGHLELNQVVYRDGQWVDGEARVEIMVSGDVRYRHVSISEGTGGRLFLVIHADQPETQEQSRLRYRSSLSLATAQFDYREGEASATFEDVGIYSQGSLFHTTGGQISRQGTRLKWIGTFKDVHYQDSNHRIQIPIISLGQSGVRIDLDDQSDAVDIAEITTNAVRFANTTDLSSMTLVTEAPLHISDIDWHGQDRRSEMRLEGGEIRMAPLSATWGARSNNPDHQRRLASRSRAISAHRSTGRPSP